MKLAIIAGLRDPGRPRQRSIIQEFSGTPTVSWNIRESEGYAGAVGWREWVWCEGVGGLRIWG